MSRSNDKQGFPIYALAQKLGLNAFFRFFYRRSVTFLTFHSVVPDSYRDAWHPLQDPHRLSEVEAWLSGLKKKFRFIDIETATKILSREISPIKNALVLTFDDAYRNNVDGVLPILKRLSIPAIFYVPTGLVSDGRKLWVDTLDFVFQQAAMRQSEVNLSDESIDFASENRDALKKQFKKLRRRWKSSLRTEQAFVEKLSEFFDNAAVSQEELAAFESKRDLWSALASWPEIQTAVASELVTIGSHSSYHSRLSLSDAETVLRELRDSKRKIEDVLRLKCEHFAYPNGEHNLETRRAVQESGYLTAATSDYGKNFIGCDLLSLKRLTIPVGSSLDEVVAIVSGSKGALLSIRSALGLSRTATRVSD